MIIDPRPLSAVQWIDFTSLALSNFGPVIKIERASEWKQWALDVVQIPAIAALDVPDPDEFENWQEWAIRFNQNCGAVL